MSSPSNSNPQLVGMVGSTQIIAELVGGFASIVAVTLSADYQLLYPAGYPDRPPAGCSDIHTRPSVLLSGTSCNFFNGEAAALIAAGAATAD
jgi:hypothetical protein